MDMSLLTAALLLLAAPQDPPVGFPNHRGETPSSRGNALYAQGKYEEALALYREGETKDAGSWRGTCVQQRIQAYRYAQAAGQIEDFKSLADQLDADRKSVV